MNRIDFSRKMAEDEGITYAEGKKTVDMVIRALAKEIEQDGYITLYGLGSFKVEEKREKPYRHPVTGEMQIMPAKKFVKFTPCESVKEAINK